MDSLSVGQAAPPVELRNLDGALVRLESQKGRLTVLNFWSAECPWSERADPVILAAAREARADLWTIACCWGESQDAIRAVASARGLPVVLFDPDQEVADRYRALATPHVFVVDEEGTLRYGGAPDDTGFGFAAPTRDYLADALRALRDGGEPDPAQTPVRGCAIVRRPPDS